MRITGSDGEESGRSRSHEGLLRRARSSESCEGLDRSAGEGVRTHHTWVNSSGIPAWDRSVRKGLVLARVLGEALCHGLLNVSNLARMELVCRRRQLIEANSPGQPSCLGGDPQDIGGRFSEDKKFVLCVGLLPEESRRSARCRDGQPCCGQPEFTFCRGHCFKVPAALKDVYSLQPCPFLRDRHFVRRCIRPRSPQGAPGCCFSLLLRFATRPAPSESIASWFEGCEPQQKSRMSAPLT